MRRIVVAALVFLAVVARAQATAGVSCRAEDASAKLGLSAAFTRGLGGGLVNFGAALQILAEAPPELRALQFERSEVSLVWFYGRDLKFQLHRERPSDGPPGYVDLVIETRQSREDESLYRGTYVLNINYRQDQRERSLALRGRVQCYVE